MRLRILCKTLHTQGYNIWKDVFFKKDQQFFDLYKTVFFLKKYKENERLSVIEGINGEN